MLSDQFTCPSCGESLKTVQRGLLCVNYHLFKTEGGVLEPVSGPCDSVEYDDGAYGVFYRCTNCHMDLSDLFDEDGNYKDERDGDAMNGLWLEDIEGKFMYIIPLDEESKHDEIIGPDNEVSDALLLLWREYENPRTIPEEKLKDLGFVVIPDILKRWGPKDGYYHA